jgi:hypothetical protein
VQSAYLGIPVARIIWRLDMEKKNEDGVYEMGMIFRDREG